MTDPPRETSAKVWLSRDGAREAGQRTPPGIDAGCRRGATIGRPVAPRIAPQIPRLGLRARVRKLLDRHVPAREVLLLGPGPIMSRRFSPRRQVAIGLTAAVVGIWLVGASVDVAVRHYVAHRMWRELAQLRATTQADAAEFARLARVAGDLARRHAQFRAASNDTAALGGDLARLDYLLEHANASGGSDDLVTRVSSAVAALAQAHGRQSALSIELRGELRGEPGDELAGTQGEALAAATDRPSADHSAADHSVADRQAADRPGADRPGNDQSLPAV